MLLDWLRRHVPRRLHEPLEELIPGLWVVPKPRQDGQRHALDHLKEQFVIGFHGASVPRSAWRVVVNTWRDRPRTRSPARAGLVDQKSNTEFLVYIRKSANGVANSRDKRTVVDVGVVRMHSLRTDSQLMARCDSQRLFDLQTVQELDTPAAHRAL